jgi:hypothetical protein
MAKALHFTSGGARPAQGIRLQTSMIADDDLPRYERRTLC